jgi:hypothetical protein
VNATDTPITKSNIAMMWKQHQWTKQRVQKLSGADAGIIQGHMNQITIMLLADLLEGALANCEMLSDQLTKDGVRMTALRDDSFFAVESLRTSIMFVQKEMAA